VCTSIGVERIEVQRTPHGTRNYQGPPTPEHLETLASFEVPTEDTRRFADLTGAHYPIHEPGATSSDTEAGLVVQGIVLLINLLSTTSTNECGTIDMWFREPIRTGSMIDCRRSQSNPQFWVLARANTDSPIAIAHLTPDVTDALLAPTA
jgi:hypothetical protein